MNKANRILGLLLALCAMLTFNGCGDDEPEKQPVTPTPGQADDKSLTVSATDVTLPANGGSTTVTVTTTASQWEAESNQAWCTTSKSGNTLTITASENNSTEQRKATVNVKAKDVTGVKTITVTQVGKGQKMLTLSVSNFNYHQSGRRPSRDIQPVIVNTDVSADGLRVESDADWCHPGLYGGESPYITFAVDRNNSPQQRIATITVTIVETGKKASFTVTQAADDGKGYFIVGYYEDSDTIFPHEHGYSSFVTTNRSNVTAVSDVDWLRPKAVSNGNGDFFEYYAEEYPNSDYERSQPRLGTVTFYDGSTPIGTYTVLQNVDASIDFVVENLRTMEGSIFAQFYLYDVSPAGGVYDMPIFTRSCKWYFRYETEQSYKQLEQLGHAIDNSWFTVEKLNHAMLRVRVQPRPAGNTTTRYGAFTVLPSFSGYYLNSGMLRTYMLPTIVLVDSADPQLGGENYGYGEHTDFD